MLKVYIIKTDITFKALYIIEGFLPITVLTIKKVTTKQRRWKKNNLIVKRDT